MPILTKSELLDSITTNLPDNTLQLITPAILRAELIKLIDSMLTVIDGSNVFEYSSVTEYNEGDLVRYLDNIFVKINGSATGITPVDGSDWTLLSDSSNFGTETVYGIVRYASTTDMVNGTSSSSAVSPLRLQTKLSNYVLSSLIGAVSGVASLDSLGKVPSSQLPSIAITDVYVVADINERNALTVQTGDVAKVLSESKTYIYDGSVWIEISAGGGGGSVNAEDVAFTSAESPTRFTTTNVRDALDEIEVLTRNTEFSYSFIKNENFYIDYFVDGLMIETVTKTIGINTVEFSLNNGAYFNILTALPYTIPNNSEIKIRITYNNLYNVGVIVCNGKLTV